MKIHIVMAGCEHEEPIPVLAFVDQASADGYAAKANEHLKLRPRWESRRGFPTAAEYDAAVKTRQTLHGEWLDAAPFPRDCEHTNYFETCEVTLISADAAV